MIFARNGTGKSFLSRAFRYLDLYCQGKDISEAALNLVSDESQGGKGSFSFSRGGSCLGSLCLQKEGNSASAETKDTIFRVFSEDFVQEELRERKFSIDGKIENEIAIDSENINIKSKKEELTQAEKSEREDLKSLAIKFDEGKSKELNKKAEVNKRLRAYTDLNIETLLNNYTSSPSQPVQSFVEILKDLDNLKGIPAEPAYPEQLKLISFDDINLNEIKDSLVRITSPSSVSDKIKRKIENDHQFIKSGVFIIQQTHTKNCPFCEQDITAADPKSIIESYLAYLADEEEKHKNILREFSRKLRNKEDVLKEVETHYGRQLSRFEALKQFVPSKKDANLDSLNSAIGNAREAIAKIKDKIEQKEKDLANQIDLPSEEIIHIISIINETIKNNNTKSAELQKAVEKADEERKSLQRNACSIFENEFVIKNWTDIEKLHISRSNIKNIQEEISKLEKEGSSISARDRVSKTFELLLKYFFNGKYIFDRTNFVLKRKDTEMSRGPHRTLSDGEKTVIAFCYFIACIHRKVAADSDYKKLFLVFDDPVTSLSYDYIFSIAQILKNLNISNKGEVSINSSKINGNNISRPELLILIHSSYFFNILRSNKVVKAEATFTLQNKGDKHELKYLKNYVAPFDQQLKHVYDVTKNREPDYGTGNAIRSVLESIGRFCRPDKSQSLQDFINFLAEDGLSIKSILINS